ncbi:MAG: UPF0175 family protein [Cyanobacteria bacterium J06638_20]
MTLQLTIPDPVTEVLRLPQQQMEQELLKELAIALYEREMLPFSTAVELAQLEAEEFSKLVGERGISRRCTLLEKNGQRAYSCSE